MLGRSEKQAVTDTSMEPLSLVAGRTSALLKLTGSFLLLVLVTFVSVEGWRAWRDYRQAFTTAQDSVTNLARAMSQHADDVVRQVDVMTAALTERIQGDGIEHIDIPRIHELLVQQAQLMPQLHGIFIYGPKGDWIVTDKDAIPKGANNADRDYFIYPRTWVRLRSMPTNLKKCKILMRSDQLSSRKQSAGIGAAPSNPQTPGTLKTSTACGNTCGRP